jgi:CIC family chloride channel protein
MKGSNQQDFPVVDAKGMLTGIISMTDLRQAMADTQLHGFLVAQDIADAVVATVTMEDSLNTALQLMASLDVRELPVVSSEHPDRIASLISRKDVVIAYHAEMERLKKPEFTKA